MGTFVRSVPFSVQKHMKIVLPSNHEVLIDDEDFEKLSEYKWRFVSNRYAAAVKYDTGKRKNDGTLKQRVIKMHRLIMDCPIDKVIDHINGNGLDNRKENLRICTRSQNMANQKKRYVSKSGYKGVSLGNNKTNPWRAYINKKESGKSKQHHLGFFSTKEGAALAYNKKAKELWGEFANLNVI